MAIIIHNVGYKENMHSIARKYGLPHYIIAQENGINEAREGMRLIIPNIKGRKYIVQPKETLEDIARANNIGIDSIIKNNNGVKKVFLGQIIYLPYE